MCCSVRELQSTDTSHETPSQQGMLHACMYYEMVACFSQYATEAVYAARSSGTPLPPSAVPSALRIIVMGCMGVSNDSFCPVINSPRQLCLITSQSIQRRMYTFDADNRPGSVRNFRCIIHGRMLNQNLLCSKKKKKERA